MLELRVDRTNESTRVVLIGSLEWADLPYLRKHFDELANTEIVRIVIPKLGRLNHERFTVLHKTVLRARERGQTCLWCGPLPQARLLLEPADEGRHIVATGAADLDAARWVSG